MFAFSSIILFFFYQRTWKGLRFLCLIGAIAIITSMPYWLTIILRFGSAVFFIAFRTGEFSLTGTLMKLIYFNVLQETLIAMISFIALIGIIFHCKQRKYFLPVWLLFIFIFGLRSLERNALICISLLSAIGLEEILKWLNEKNVQSIEEVALKGQLKNPQENLKPSKLSNIVILGLFFEIFFFAILGKFLGTNILKDLNQENRTAMAWVKTNTPETGKFLVMPSGLIWQVDSIEEWFPALSERTSVTTVQGSEWLKNAKFAENVQAYIDVKACANQGISCLSAWEKDNHVNVDYYYFSLNESPNQEPSEYASPLEAEMKYSGTFRLVYRNSDVRIYQKLGTE
jgi:hypothetical protein